jgi:hypothetical protein
LKEDIYKLAQQSSRNVWEKTGNAVEESKKEAESLVLKKGFYNKREDIPKKSFPSS